MSLPVSYTSASLMAMTMTALGSMSTMTHSALLHHAGRAEALINAKIAKRYSLPLASVPGLLEALATDMAIYNVLTSQITIKKEDPWLLKYKGAIDILDDIAKGEIPLVGADYAVIPGRSDIMEAYSNTMNYHPTFWEGPQELQEQDSDKIEDEADIRDITIKDILK